MTGRLFTSMLLAVALAACGRDGAAATLDTPFRLAPGQSAAFKAEKLEVTFVGVVSDSRCPTDLKCFWAGTVTVQLAIRSNGKRTEHEADEFTKVAVDGYTVTVLETLPPRGLERQRIAPADYRVTLKVTR